MAANVTISHEREPRFSEERVAIRGPDHQFMEICFCLVRAALQAFGSMVSVVCGDRITAWRRVRRMRAWLRHERLSLQMALADHSSLLAKYATKQPIDEEEKVSETAYLGLRSINMPTPQDQQEEHDATTGIPVKVKEREKSLFSKPSTFFAVLCRQR